MAESQVTIQVGVTGAEALNRLKDQMAAVDAAATKAQGSVPAAANGIKAMGPAANAAAGGVGALGAAIQSALGPLLALSTAIGIVKKGLDVAFESDNIENRLRILTGSTGEFDAAMAAASVASERFGMTQNQAGNAIADVYGRMKGLGYGLKETNELFTGFNVIAKQAGVSADDAAGAFLQFGQAMGSGKLSGDELAIILERMPQLAQHIAAEMGVSAGSIKQLGSEGKVTSDILYSAMAKAAQGVDGLGDSVTAQQAIFAKLGQISEQLLKKIGKFFSPFVMKGMEALVWAGERLNEWWGYLADQVFPKVAEAVKPVVTELMKIWEQIDWDWLLNIVQNLMLAGINAMIQGVKNLSTVLGFVLEKFRELANSPIIKSIINGIGAILDKLGLTRNTTGEWAKEQKAVKDEAFKSIDNYSKIPPKVEDAKEAAKKLKEAQKAVTEEIKQTIAKADEQAKLQTSAVDNQLKLTNARIAAETAVNNVLLQQAERQLNAAKTQEDRVAAAEKIRDLTKAQAELELKSTTAAIDAEIRKAVIAKQSADLRAKEVLSIVRMAEAQGTVTAAHYESLAAQEAAVQIANDNLVVAKALAKEQTIVANAIYKGKIAAADAAYQQNIVAKETQSAASAAGEFASNMEKGASAAERAASATSQAAAGLTVRFGEAGKNTEFAEAYRAAIKNVNDELRELGLVGPMAERRIDAVNTQFLQLAESYNQAAAAQKRAAAALDWEKVTGDSWFKHGLPATGATAPKVPAYASGGYVTSPELAMVGEGGEHEYVIPQSKMASAMANYAAGKRGNAVLSAPSQINLTYSGNIIRQDQGDYLSTSAVPGIVRQAVDQTISTLGRNPGARRSAGIS